MSNDKRKQRRPKAASRKQTTGKRRASPVSRDRHGRAHLAIHRDERGRAVGVELAAPLFAEDWQNEIAAAAANTVHGVLEGGASLENAVTLARNAMDATSALVEGLLRVAADAPPACKAGCAHCCHQFVGVSAPEVFAIHEHLRATRSGPELDALVRRVRETRRRTRSLGPADRYTPEHPCPFLEGERCGIYEVRPLACRGKNSLDAEACSRTLREPEARRLYFAGEYPVPSYLEPLRAFHAVASGVDLALHELYRLRGEPLELAAAMLAVFDDPDGTPAAWLCGDDPFHEARGADGSENPFITELSGRLDPG